MFPKNRINIICRLLCLISYIVVILLINSPTTLIVLFLLYCFFGLCEKSFRNIEFIVLTIIIWGLCYLLKNYLLLKIMLIISYSFYFLDTSYYVVEVEEVKVTEKDYIRFKKRKKKKGSNDIIAVYLTVHLVLLFLAIMVG